MPFTLGETRVESQTGSALAAGIVKAAAKFRLKDSVASIQQHRQEKQAVGAILRLIQDMQSKNLSEETPKAICFLATEALAQLSTTSGEALTSLKQLQNHPNPVISAQAKLQMALLRR